MREIDVNSPDRSRASQRRHRIAYWYTITILRCACTQNETVSYTRATDERLGRHRFVSYLIVSFCFTEFDHVIQYLWKSVRVQRVSPRLVEIVEETRNGIRPQPIHHIVEQVYVFSTQVY